MPSSLPTLILRNARIHTFGSTGMAEALAIRAGTVVAAGRDAEVDAAVGSDTPSVDVEGRVILPGLIDAHVHWSGYALARRRLQLDPQDDLSDVQRAVRQRAAETPPDRWILGRGWDHDGWGRWPRAEDLDVAAPDHAVALMRKDGHVAWLNHRALEIAGIGSETPDPAGGKIVRDPDREGAPTGILQENATQLVRAAVPSATAYERQAAMIAAWPEAWCRGLTGLHDMGLDRRSSFRDLATLRDAGDLGLRMVWYLQKEELDEAIGLGLRSGMGDEWLRIGGLKLFLDGTLGSQTADMLEPYEGQPENRGIATIPYDEYVDLVIRASEAGLSTAVHAIGDAANRKALDGFEAAASHDAGRLRQRVEHCQLLHPDDVRRFAELRVVASMQPVHAIADMTVADRYWGPRAAHAYAWRSVLDSGATLAFGSDAPIETLDAFAGVHAAVTRQAADGRPAGGWRPEQSLTVRQALAAYTVGAAYAVGLEDTLGTLDPGHRADLIVLDRDPLTVPPSDVRDTQVLATMIEGVWVWQDAGVEFGGPRHSS